MLEMILRHARANPAKIALVSGEQKTTYLGFARSIVAACTWLERHLPAGDGVTVVLTANPLIDWVTVLALRVLGRTPVTVPDLATLRQLRLPAIAGAIALTDATELRAGALGAGLTFPIVSLTSKDLLEIARGPAPAAFGPRPFGDYIEYTSGTTGNHKAIRRVGAKLDSLCARTAREYRIDSETVFHFGALPPSSSVGSKCPVTVWYHGGTCLFDLRKDRFDRLAENGVNRIFVTTGHLEAIARSERARPMPQLIVFTGGGFVSFKASELLRRTVGCTVLLNYGGTEFGVRLQHPLLAEEDAVWIRPFENADMQILDENGRECPPGVEGQLRIRLHDCDPDGYVGDEEATRRFFRDGYFHTGDLAIERGDGRIRILGRSSDVLNIGGMKRPVGALEAQAKELLQVESLCLFTQQSDGGEGFLLVAIEQGDAVAKDASDRFLAQFGPAFQRVAIRYFARFPRKGAMQKIDRDAVLAEFRQREAATASRPAPNRVTVIPQAIP